MSMCAVGVAVMLSVAWITSIPSNPPTHAAEPTQAGEFSRAAGASSGEPATGGSATVHLLEEAFRESGRGTRVEAPSVVEMRSVARLFARTLVQDDDFVKLKTAWAEWKMTLTNIESGGKSFWLLQEFPLEQRGRGIYAFRTPKAVPLVLQAPHSGFDQHTGEIVIRLFAEHPLRCAAWNSVSRGLLDVAHVEETYFQAFTRAIGETVPDVTVVQIHGFDERKRDTAAGARASLIVSNGTDRPAPWFLKAGLAFGRGLPAETVAVYPVDIHELGGTTNAQGGLLHQLGHRNFLHLECNRSFRQRLRAQPPARAEFMDCLGEFLRIKSNPR
jgi:hypothetical protein